MRVWFVGVGAACDPTEANTSLAVASGPSRLLLDCGFSAAQAYLRAVPEPEHLDAVVLSHYHGDHFFGLPALLLYFWEIGRRAPLTICGPAGLEELVPAVVDLAYGSLRGRLDFPLTLVTTAPGQRLDLGPFGLSFALPEHSAPCQAVRVDTPEGSLFYSGDGRPTPQTQALAQGVNLVVHESFEWRERVPGHGSITDSIAFARAAGARHLAAVHLRREVRREEAASIRAALSEADGLTAWLPVSGETWTLD